MLFKKIKHAGIKLTKKIKDIYSKNYTMLLNEIKEVIFKWKDIYELDINMIKIMLSQAS